MDYAEHLARLALADLFLDTVPFNAGTTASDFLWAGVPVLTCAGESFAARMAGSLLNTLGVPELITPSLEAYEARALELLSEPEALPALRRRLIECRERSALFDTGRFTRHLERAYELMTSRARAQLPPATLHVERLD